MHKRRTILNATITRCTGLTTTGANVYEDPSTALEEGNIPALVVEASGESATIIGSLGGSSSIYQQSRALTVDVTTITKSATARDTSTEEIEIAMMGTAIDGALEQRLSRTSFEVNGDGAYSLWSATLSFEMTFLTNSNTPST